MRRLTSLSVAVALAGLSLAEAQQAPTSLTAPPVAALLGEWQGTGTLLGQPAEFTMAWERRLGGRFLHLRFANAQIVNGARRPIIEAEAFYRAVGPTELAGAWFDSRGAVLDLSGTVTDTSLVVEWVAPTERGRTVYRIVSDSLVETTDYVYGTDGPRVFGRGALRRSGIR